MLLVQALDMEDTFREATARDLEGLALRLSGTLAKVVELSVVVVTYPVK